MTISAEAVRAQMVVNLNAKNANIFTTSRTLRTYYKKATSGSHGTKSGITIIADGGRAITPNTFAYISADALIRTGNLFGPLGWQQTIASARGNATQE